jgi:hypothetical protein
VRYHNINIRTTPLLKIWVLGWRGTLFVGKKHAIKDELSPGLDNLFLNGLESKYFLLCRT